MPDLTFPLIAATVFTVVGYGILRAERQAESIGDILSAVFALCAPIAMVWTMMLFADRFPTHTASPPATVSARAPPARGPVSGLPQVYWAGD